MERTTQRSETKQDRLARAMQDAALPFSFNPVARRVLKRTPEYRQALAERRAKAWLDSEAYSLCQLLAATTRNRLGDLDP